MKKFGILVGLLLNTLLFFLSYIVPKRPGTILMGGGLGKRFCGNPKYFYLHLCNRSLVNPGHPVSFSWITKNRAIYEQLARQDKPVINAWSLKGFWAVLRAEQLVIESGNAPGIGGHDIAYERLLLGRFEVYQTWHGTPLKRICLDVFKDRVPEKWFVRLYLRLYRMELRSLSSILALSDIAKQRFLTAFENENIEVLGYPKNDAFYGDPGRWGIKSKWQAFSKILVYAPTFRDHADEAGPFRQNFLGELNQQLKTRNWCFLIKLHQFDRTTSIPVELSNIFDVSNETDDVQELLAQTDVLISDYSSIFIDFLLLKKPVIFYIYDLKNYLEQSRQMYCEYVDEVPGPFARNEGELLELIMNVDEWFAESTYRERFNQVVDFYHAYQDGSSSLRFERFLVDRSTYSKHS